MTGTSSVATSLLQAGVLLAVALLARIAVARHLPVDSLPVVLRHRVTLSNRVCPWLFLPVVAIIATGLVLHILG